MDFSRKNNLLIAEYELLSKELVYSELFFEVKEIWLESSWKYSNSKGKIEKMNNQQLVIGLSENVDLTTFIKEWNVCVNDDCKSGSGSGNISLGIKNVSDTLNIKVVSLKDNYSLNEIDKILMTFDFVASKKIESMR